MSWEFEGVTYHSTTERDQARQRSRQQRAIAEAESLRATVQEHSRKIASDRAELDRARGDVTRQQEISRRIASNVANMRREQQHLDQRLQAAQAEMKQGFEEVRSKFAEVRGEMNRGLEEAERKRAEADALLQSEINQVRAEAERREAARLARAQDELGQARERFALAEELLDQMQPQLKRLDLDANAAISRQQIASGPAMIAEKRSEAALAVSTVALDSARGIQLSVRKRQEDILTAQTAIIERAASLASRLAVAPGSELTTYFGEEASAAKTKLENFQLKARASFQNYATVAQEQAHFEQELQQLDEITLEMISSASTVKSLAERRADQARSFVKKLESIYNVRTGLVQRLAIPGDPKSPLILDCRFGGAAVRLTMDLDGGYQVDAAGHSSDAQCGLKMEQTLALLRQDTAVVRHDAIPGNPQSHREEPRGEQGAAPSIRERLKGVAR